MVIPLASGCQRSQRMQLLILICLILDFRYGVFTLNPTCTVYIQELSVVIISVLHSELYKLRRVHSRAVIISVVPIQRDVEGRDIDNTVSRLADTAHPIEFATDGDTLSFWLSEITENATIDINLCYSGLQVWCFYFESYLYIQEL